MQDFELSVGQLEEQVTVTGAAPPIFGRNVFYTAIATAGVIQTGDPQFVRFQDQTNASYLSLGGGPRRGNGYLIEGVPMTDFVNRLTIVPSIEAVEELRVQIKTYEADMGHAAGGVFNTTARSGSNAWHGSAVLVSKPNWAIGPLYFAKRANAAKPEQNYYGYAGSLGGPLVRARTFFWLSTDNYRKLGTRNSVLTLPTARERAGDFSQTRSEASRARSSCRPG